MFKNSRHTNVSSHPFGTTEAAIHAIAFYIAVLFCLSLSLKKARLEATTSNRTALLCQLVCVCVCECL